MKSPSQQPLSVAAKADFDNESIDERTAENNNLLSSTASKPALSYLPPRVTSRERLQTSGELTLQDLQSKESANGLIMKNKILLQ